MDGSTIGSILSLDKCIEVVEAAFAAHARGQSLAPQLTHVHAHDGEFHIKAGGLCIDRPYFVCKINAGFFKNPSRFGLPSISGLIVLCDAENGSPLALFQSGELTRLRTGAATAVAAKYLARSDSEVVTICGAGRQCEIQLRSLCQVLPIRLVHLWSRSNAQQTAERLSAILNLPVLATGDLVSATRQSDVIVTCTPATSWFLGRQHVKAGTFIAAIGADSPGKQEIEPKLLAEVRIVPDLLEQAKKVGDLHHAYTAGLITSNQVLGELGDVVVGKASGRSFPEEIIVFDSTGTALQDAAVAVAAYERARVGNLGTLFEFSR